MASPKMGRPTDNPKPVQVTVRFDRKTLEILDKYCEENKVTRAEGIRIAVNGLKK